MAFTVFGAGIKDNVPFKLNTNNTVIEQTFPTPKVRKIDAEEEHQDQTADQNLLVKKTAGKAYASTSSIHRERGIAVYAHQIMTTPVVTISPNAVITDAWTLFRERRFRHIPVVTQQKKIYGIISDRDLLRYAATSGNVPPYKDTDIEASMTIESLLKSRVITATQDTEIRQIARMLFEQRVGVMPIVLENGTVEGVITRSDILRTIVNNAPLELWV